MCEAPLSLTTKVTKIAKVINKKTKHRSSFFVTFVTVVNFVVQCRAR